MKKFFSLLCATLLVFSASAAPQAKKAEIAKKAPVAVEQMQKVQFEKAQIADFDQLSATPELKVNNFKSQALAKAPQATQAEPIVVIIDGAPSIQPAGDMQAITVTGKDNMIYAWGVKTTSLEAGKTYAFTDMNTDFTYRCTPDYYTTYEDPTDATFSIDAENNITASIVTESGTYMVYTNDPTPVTPTLADRYDATGLVSKDGGNTWSEAPAWVATVGADQYGPCITNLIPQGPFANPVALNYVTVGNQIVLPATPLTQVSQTELVYAMDITDFLTGGTGDIVLNVAQDGNISANPSHLYGYVKATFDASTYAPTEMKGVYQIYGNLAYSIAKPITERDTVDVVTTFMRVDDFVEDMGVAQLWVGADYLQTTGDIQFSVTIQNTESLTGTFSFAENTLMNDFTLIINSEGEKTFFQNGEVTITNDEYPILKGWLIGDDEKYYRLDWSKKPIEKRDTLRFSGQGVTISECISSQTGVQTGWLYGVTDASTGYRFTLQSTVVANKYGTFSYEDKTLGSNYYNVYDPQGNRQQFVEGSITVGEVGDSIVLDGELIAEDEKVYILHFAQANTVLNFDTDAPFDATFAYSDMSKDLDEGVIGIYATNAEGYTIGLELYADPAATEIPAGVYTISDSQEAGTALQSLGVAGGYLTECYAGTRAASGGIDDCWFLVEGTITLSYDEYDKLKVVVDAKNSYGQPVTALIAYEKFEPKSTVEIANAEVYVYDGFVELYGIMNFYGGNADGFMFDLYAYADTYAGDFLEAIDFGDCELTLADGSHVGVIDAYEFKVEADGKNLTLTAKVLGSDTIQYNISATGYLGYIQGDAVEGYVGEFAMENITLLQATKSQVMINGFNEAGDTVAIVFDAKFSKTAGTIVEPQAGEYDVIMASTGFTEEYDVNPSFVGNNAGVWFIQSGKLIIAEDGSMAFLGVNSYDAPVAIDFTVPAGPATDYYLVGWINNAAYGIEGDIDNFGDYHFVDGKVRATFDVMSYVQVKDNNKQIYGTDSYIAPVESGNATLVANGPEKIAINGGVEYEYTLVVNEDGTLTLNYAVVTVGLRNTKANMKAAKRVANGQIVIVRENKEYNILGAAL